MAKNPEKKELPDVKMGMTWTSYLGSVYGVLKATGLWDGDRDSLQFGVNEWKREYHINSSYACGRKGYENLITALEKGDFQGLALHI